MRKNRKYSPEFKISCIIDMREHHLSYNETARKYLCEKGQESIFKGRLKLWERIFLEEGEAGLYKERRGRTTKMDNPNKGKKKKLDMQVKEDLIAENQRLKEENQYYKAEIEYLKKLDALVRAEEQKKNKKH
ncbi:TPA: helix-turn-helix domain-containing protein [Candidatus Avigastranaerophilus faecigallinarum]|mgnify:CR=1 FL=1|nr:helix-turn-helix domain-containing protein [Candidatus Avigastranaerophilus faecigallinarum]